MLFGVLHELLLFLLSPRRVLCVCGLGFYSPSDGRLGVEAEEAWGFSPQRPALVFLTVMALSEMTGHYAEGQHRFSSEPLTQLIVERIMEVARHLLLLNDLHI